LNDTWAYDVNTNTWRDMSPAQSPPIGGGVMAYDIQSDRIVLFLELLDPSGRGTEYTPAGETWTYDFNTNTWMDMEPTDAPFGMLGAQMAYDAESDRVILFGGLDADVFETGVFTFYNDTWAYDFDTNTWTKMEPAISPRAQNFHTMAYDHGSDRVILFGNFEDTWAYDYNTDTWEELEPGETPSARYYCDMVYDPGSDRMILFGGARAAGEAALGDTWAYHFDTNTWTELEPDTHPSERGWYAAVYSTEAERIVLFGGGRNRYAYTDETWIYDPEASTWTNVSPSP
jgi:N-acetylneuraminic acid mutarotase